MSKPRIPHDAYCQHDAVMGACQKCEDEVTAALEEARHKGHMDILTYKRLNHWQRRRIDEMGQ